MNNDILHLNLQDVNVLPVLSDTDMVHTTIMGVYYDADNDQIYQLVRSGNDLYLAIMESDYINLIFTTTDRLHIDIALGLGLIGRDEYDKRLTEWRYQTDAEGKARDIKKAKRIINSLNLKPEDLFDV